MKPETLLHADYLDILYDNRNKSYGGYELRKHYHQRLGRAAVLMLTAVAAVAWLSLRMANHKDMVHASLIPFSPTLIDITHPPKALPKVLPKIVPPQAAQKFKTKFFTDPIIAATDDVPDDKRLNPITSNDHPGLTGGQGDSTGFVETPESGIGTGIKPVESKPNEPLVWVKQMPEFSGDLNTYIGTHMKYPDIARESNITGTVLIKFVVNEDGSVSDASVVRGIGGGCDEEALRMVDSMPKWKPGKQNGIAVKVFFTIPIKFVLD